MANFEGVHATHKSARARLHHFRLRTKNDKVKQTIHVRLHWRRNQVDLSSFDSKAVEVGKDTE